MSWRTLLFPYRSHLEAEIEYLRSVLASRTRRQDELEGAILELMQKLREKTPKEPPANVKLPVRGWDAYRAQRRNDDAREEAAPAVPAELEARGQGSPDDFVAGVV